MSTNIPLLKSYIGWYRFAMILSYIGVAVSVMYAIFLVVTIIGPIIFGLLAYYSFWQAQKYGKCIADLEAITEENYSANTESLALIQGQMMKIQGIINIAGLGFGIIGAVVTFSFGVSLINSPDFQNVMKSMQSSMSSSMNSSNMNSSMMQSSSSSLYSAPTQSN